MRSKRRRILLVDDEPSVLEALEDSLRREPWMVQSATSAGQALEILAVTSADVVVSDERMPGMTGSEFLARVCREYPDVMRIMLTGQASLEAAVRAINEGQVFRILLKPCRPDDLRNVLRSAVHVKALHEETQRLLAEARRRRQLLGELEQRHPGITRLERDGEGLLHMDDADAANDPEALLRQIEHELGGGSAAA